MTEQTTYLFFVSLGALILYALTNIYISVTGGVSAQTYKILDVVDKMTGLEFEAWCAQLMRAHGFQVERIGKPGDQGVDLIATKYGRRYAVQCKRAKKRLGNAAVQQVFSGKTYHDCDAAAVVTNSTFTKSAVELATKTGVLLWDRQVLENWLGF